MKNRLQINGLRFTLVAAIAGASMAIPAQTDAQSSGRPRYSIRTARYEIYAGDSAVLLDAQQNIEQALARFRQYFDSEPSPLAVVYMDGSSATLDMSDFASRGFLTLPMLTPTGTVSATKPVMGEGVLAHEACHQFFIDYVDRKLGSRALTTVMKSSYGHPAIPDWFDEAIATLCEGDKEVALRQADLRKRFADHISFGDLFRMEHPLARAHHTTSAPTGAASDAGEMRFRDASGKEVVLDSARAERIRRALAGDTTVGVRVQMSGVGSIGPVASTRIASVTSTVVDGSTGDAGSALIFYGETQSLGQFIISQGGPRSIQRVADALAAGKSSTEAVATINGLPSDPAGLEKSWTSWFQTRGR